MIFHVLNRGNARDLIFDTEADYAAFEKVLAETQTQVPLRILSYCLMPNHWHLVLWPLQDGDLGRFMQRLTTTHVRRWHLHRHSVGTGHLYQGTYKSFPVEEDDHLYTVLRYVERNPVRPTLVDRAEAWQWGSLWRWEHPSEHSERPTLCPWPIPRPADWVARVNRALTKKELAAVRVSVVRGRPFGSETWQESTATQLGLESTFRSRGRPIRGS
jgi:putative transposase